MLKTLIGLMVLLNILHADQKVVFDCAAGDMRFVHTRMSLIELSAKEFRENKVPHDFVLTIHSKCTPIVEKSSQNKVIQGIHKKLEKLTKDYNVKIEVCGIATNKFGYSKNDLLPFIDVVNNSITRVIQLQNNGYAFIPYH